MQALGIISARATAFLIATVIAGSIPSGTIASPPARNAVLDVPRAAKPTFVRPEPSHLEFSLEWTSSQIHRVADSRPIEILLPGRIASDIANVWTLANSSHEPPALIFVEDIFGHSRSTQPNIPVTCEISLDGHEFQPMTLPSSGALGTVFPPGMHTFQLRITGRLSPFQPAGYYRLQLVQNLTPLM